MMATLLPFVAEFLSVHAQDVAASDLATAGAVAAAIAGTTGRRVLGVYSAPEYEKLLIERAKGTSSGKA